MDTLASLVIAALAGAIAAALVLVVVPELRWQYIKWQFRRSRHLDDWRIEKWPEDSRHG